MTAEEKRPLPRTTARRVTSPAGECRAIWQRWMGDHPVPPAPTEWARRHFRDQYRGEVTAALAWLITYIEGDSDELSICEKVRDFADHITRKDAALRRNLAGDRHPGPGASQPVPIQRTA